MSVSARNAGFTLVELLLVVALIAVLSSFLIPGFSNYMETQNIRQAQELFKSDLRTVQNKALTGVGSSDSSIKYWGLKITSDLASNYFFFSSSDNTAGDCDGAVSQEVSDTLPGGVVIKGSSGACVFFSLRNGNAKIRRNNNSEIFNLGYEEEDPPSGVEINTAGMIRGVDLDL